ncbi:MAG: 5-bromo-4-chloroindolyl phosphate hydrolysis family protein, partial [Bacillota bacterium]|nr:5-bromo-4-chloroindolyl phosphate hydrolysis family protein [Bacillota bacterium]
MNPFLAFLIKTSITVPIMAVIGLVSLFGFHQGWLSLGISAVGGLLTYWVTSLSLNHRFLKKQGLTRREYRYIKGNLDEARGKVIRLHKSLLTIRHIPSIKQRVELIKV